MKVERSTRQRLLIALRRENVGSPEEVAKAVVEPTGHITIIPKRKG